MKRKCPLLPSDLQLVIDCMGSSPAHDDILFIAQHLIEFNQLLQLAELCLPDNSQLFDMRLSMKRFDVRIQPDFVHLLLPGHKADKFFAGLHLLLQLPELPIGPIPFFLCYLTLRDHSFPWRPKLWIRADGSSPTHSWFQSCLHTIFDDGMSGHSMRAVMPRRAVREVDVEP